MFCLLIFWISYSEFQPSFPIEPQAGTMITARPLVGAVTLVTTSPLALVDVASEMVVFCPCLNYWLLKGDSQNWVSNECGLFYSSLIP